MDDVNPAGIPGQEHGLLHGGIAATYDGNRLAAEEVAVARSTGGNAAAHQLTLGGQPKETRRGAGGHNQRLCFIRVFASDNLERAATHVNFTHCARFEFRTKSLRLFAHILDQLRAQNTFREPGEIFHHRR